jgi:hypothetical protein
VQLVQDLMLEDRLLHLDPFQNLIAELDNHSHSSVRERTGLQSHSYRFHIQDSVQQ